MAIIASGDYPQNIEELSGQIEGDMVLTSEQEQMVNGVLPSERTGLIDTNYRWPDNVVPYELNAIFDQAQRDHIVRGLNEIERISCLRFVERTTEVNYVEVTVSEIYIVLAMPIINLNIGLNENRDNLPAVFPMLAS